MLTSGSSALVRFQGAIASAAVYGALLGASVEECLAIHAKLDISHY